MALKYVHSNAQMELRGVRQCMNLKSPYLVDTFDNMLLIREEPGVGCFEPVPLAPRPTSPIRAKARSFSPPE